jgi:sulfatase maturation enzyme AslB (radical SAM superfamily)
MREVLSPEEALVDSLLRASVGGVASGRETLTPEITPFFRKAQIPGDSGNLMKILSYRKPVIKALDDILFYLNYRREKLLLSGEKKRSEELASVISENSDYLKEIEQGVLSREGHVSEEEIDRIFPSPDRLVVMTTHNCQLRCRYCSVRKFSARMDRKTLFRSIDLLFTSSKKDLQLQFFGGEPLIEFSLIKDGVEYAESMIKKHRKNVRFMLTTNGILLTKDKIEFLKEHNFTVEFSIDGMMETQLKTRKAADGRNYYSVVMKNLKNAAGSNLDLYTISVVTPETVDMLFRNFMYLVSQGHRRIQVNYSLGFFWSANDIKKLIRELGKIMDFVKSEKGRGIDFINITRIRKEPVVLNAEVTVDCDGTVYLETGICLEEDFNEMKRKFSVGSLDTISDIRRVSSTRFNNLYLLSKIYGEHAEHFRKIIINNIELGNLVDRYIKSYRKTPQTGLQSRVEKMNAREFRDFLSNSTVDSEVLDRAMAMILEKAERLSFADKEKSESLYRLADIYYNHLMETPPLLGESRSNIQLMITRKCQLRCRYCPVDKNGTEMPLSTVKKCIDIMFNTDMPEVTIDFLGGEPMLCFDRVKQAVEYAEKLAVRKGKKVSFFMITNAIGLTPEIADFISSHNFLLELSLDGDEKTHNEFKVPHSGSLNPYRVMTGNLKKIFKGKIRNYGIMVVTPRTVGRLEKNFIHLVDLGFRNIHINYAFGTYWDKESLDKFFAMLDRIKARYGKEISSGKIKLGNMTTRKEPAMLNSEIMVDTDGSIHLLSEWVFERFVSRDENLSISHINKINSFSDIVFTDFISHYTLSKRYTRENPRLRRIVLNNIEVGHV